MQSTRAAPVLIRPSRGWVGLGVRELWQYRELLYFLIWRDLKVRYKQTAFGASWAILQPLLLMAVFSVFLGRIEALRPADVPYPLFAFAGLVPWTLFAQSLNGAANSLVNNQNVLTKVYFPRLLLPIAGVGSFIVDFLIGTVVLLLILPVFGVTPSLGIVWLPAFALLTVVTALAVGTWLAAINVRYRDVRYAIPFLIQVWLFASPVAYSTDLVPEDLRFLYALNPMTGALEGFRWAVLGGDRPDAVVIVSAGAAMAILVAGLAYFRQVERTFADVI